MFSPAGADEVWLYQISVSRRKLKRPGLTIEAVAQIDSVDKYIVVPKVRSKAATATVNADTRSPDSDCVGSFGIKQVLHRQLASLEPPPDLCGRGYGAASKHGHFGASVFVFDRVQLVVSSIKLYRHTASLRWGGRFQPAAVVESHWEISRRC